MLYAAQADQSGEGEEGIAPGTVENGALPRAVDKKRRSSVCSVF